MRQPKLPLKIHLSAHQKRLLRYIGLGLLAFYVLATIFVWGVYRQKFFPRSTYDGKLVGNSGFSKVVNDHQLPAEILFTVDKDTVKASPAQVGLQADPNQTIARLRRERRFGTFLIFRTVTKHTYPLGTSVNEDTLKKFVATSLNRFEAAPKDAHLEVKGEAVAVINAEAGKSVNVSKLQRDLVDHLASNHTSFAVPFDSKPAKTDSGLQAKSDQLNKAIDQEVKLTYTGGSYSASKAEKAGWLSTSGNELVFDKAKVLAFLNTLQGRLGQSWDNQATIAGQINDKISGGNGVTLAMHDKPKIVRTYSYCVALRDVSESYRAGFASKIHSTYTDPRGWGLSGKINFVEASGGCDFTIWLAAANDLPAMGPGTCDNYYSCTVSPNVIINFDRWQGATDPWNAAGGSIDDYRSMVINHETGHWLGFGHRNCPGAGQPAPVMQQQSISLQGCKFNPWPAAYELQALAQLKGV